MPTQIFTYCNSSLGKSLTVTVTATGLSIVGTVVGASCSSPQPGVIGSIVNTTLPYPTTSAYLVPMNVYPYARIVPIGSECVVSIESVTVGPCTTNVSNDGTLTINALGLEYLNSYSIDGGTTWNYLNIFTGLAPGTYNCVVETWSGCRDTFVATIPFTTLVCDLALGSITTEQAAGANGKIKILSVTGFASPVEYRLDAGAWQDSAEFTGLVADTYNVQVRFKLYTSCTDSRSIIVAEAGSCDLSIVGALVTSEQFRYADDGIIQVVIEGTNGGYEYSKDDGDNYQSSNTFAFLSPGVYAIRVRDASGCEDFRSVEVFRYKPPYILFPMVNAHRVVVLTGPTVKPLQNFDNRLFAATKTPGVVRHFYNELVQADDVTTEQFRSSYINNVVKLRDADGNVVTTIEPVKKTSNLNNSEALPALFADYGANKTQIFFESGIPLFVEVGQDVTISGNVPLNGTYEIVDRAQGIGSALGYEVLIIEKIYAGAAITSGTATINYDLESYEVYEFTLIWALYTVGKYYFTVEGSDPQFLPYTAQSEPIDFQALHKDTLLLRYKNRDNGYQIKYDTGIVHNVRFKGVLRWPVIKSERTLHKDSKGHTLKLEESADRVVEFKVYDAPNYLLQRIAIAFGHDFFEVEGTEFQSAEDVDFSHFENDDKHNGSASLIEVDFFAENGDDSGTDDIDVLGDNETLLGVL